MFVKPHDVPPLLCFNVQTEMRFWLQQLQRVGVVKSCYNSNFISVCTLKQSSGGTSCGFTNIKSNWNMSRSGSKCPPVHTYRLNHIKSLSSTGNFLSILIGFGLNCSNLQATYFLSLWNWSRTSDYQYYFCCKLKSPLLAKELSFIWLNTFLSQKFLVHKWTRVACPQGNNSSSHISELSCQWLLEQKHQSLAI